jgi:hypothetical protein
MNESPETDVVLKNNAGLPIGRQNINLTEHARRMEAQRNDLFRELHEAKRMLKWHKRKTQSAVDVWAEAIRERKETEARFNSKDLLVMEATIA